MDEAGDGQQGQQRGDDVGHRCDLLTLHAEDAEPEGGEQQPAERLALEEGLTLGRDVGQLLLQVRQRRVVGLLGRGNLGGRRCALRRAEVGVGLAVGDRLDVQADEVVGVALGLLAGGERLAGVLDEAR